MASILVVCTANVCRSPVVAELVRARAAAAGHPSWQVSSAGLLGVEGWPASAGSIEQMQARGHDLSGHGSRGIDRSTMDEADVVLCMEHSHVDALRDRFPEHHERIFLFADMADEARDVVDPYGGPPSGYRKMVDDVSDLLSRGWQRLETLAAGAGR